MALIRAKQRVVTALSPHNANKHYLIPNRGKGPATIVLAFIGPPISLGPFTNGEAITPVDVSGRWNTPTTPITGYSLVGTWPAGLSINASGVISGTPTVDGSFTGLSVRATNGVDPDADSNTFSLTVDAPPFANTHVLTVANLGNGEYGMAPGNGGSLAPTTLGGNEIEVLRCKSDLEADMEFAGGTSPYSSITIEIQGHSAESLSDIGGVYAGIVDSGFYNAFIAASGGTLDMIITGNP